MDMKAKLLPVHANCQPHSGHLIPLGTHPRRRAGAVPTDTASAASTAAPGEKKKKAQKCKRRTSLYTDKNIKAVCKMIHVPMIQLSKIISIGQKTHPGSTGILSVYVDLGNTGSRRGMLGGGKRGALCAASAGS